MRRGSSGKKSTKFCVRRISDPMLNSNNFFCLCLFRTKYNEPVVNDASQEAFISRIFDDLEIFVRAYSNYTGMSINIPGNELLSFFRANSGFKRGAGQYTLSCIFFLPLRVLDLGRIGSRNSEVGSRAYSDFRLPNSNLTPGSSQVQ